MGQVSPYLRRSTTGYAHWCPGCKEMHTIPDSWTFNGNVDCPSFSPSVKVTGKQITKDELGNWLGDWVRDANGNTVDECCHYFLTNCELRYCPDCTHFLAGQTVPLPELPEGLKD